jgi:hypothetical protein
MFHDKMASHSSSKKFYSVVEMLLLRSHALAAIECGLSVDKQVEAVAGLERHLYQSDLYVTVV